MAVTDPSLTGALPNARPRLGARGETGLSWVVMTYLICMVLPLSFRLGPLAMSNLRLLLLVMTVPLLVRIYMGHFGRIRLPDILFPGFMFWTMLALMKNNPAMVIENTGATAMEFLGGYVIGRAYVRTPEQFLRLCHVLLWMVLFLMPFAFAEAFTRRLFLGEFLASIPGFGSVTTNVSNMRFGLDRVQTVFAHPIHFGLFCSMALSMVFIALKDQIPTGRRYVIAAVVLVTGCLALSSGAILAMMLFIGLVSWNTILSRVPQRWWILLWLMVVAYVVVDLLSNRTPIRVFMSYATFSADTAYWRGLIFEHGLKNVWANPLLGLGFNDWVRPSFMHSSSVDNFWLLMAMRYGIPAFLMLMIGVFVPVFRIMFRRYGEDMRLRNIRLAWIFTFVGLSFTLATVHIWGNVFSLVFFMFGAGIWLIEAQPASADEEARADETGPAARSGTRFSRFAPVKAEDRAGQETEGKTGDKAEGKTRQPLPQSRAPRTPGAGSARLR
ncbi:O-antigen ligase family protein [Pacificoceanicola onchidii]|uniref:O-antigen ligase family protein n=1 Tax=Pacificoceanicola onchidii TaxID=2562685 RepID=UPI0010A66777|nr:O-antigen ligase family protein [Pacificoceanicola onchidii]